ncbi:hypothetical protein J4Q44_G00261500 [Coregonus suidteri]|uniref:RNA-binding protein 38 n=1 Tax=Coregonus suidteri TaxID=861788 RepID=A0AAN8QLU3_9TELE
MLQNRKNAKGDECFYKALYSVSYITITHYVISTQDLSIYMDPGLELKQHREYRNLLVTMIDRGAAEQACKDPNPVVDGRKTNVNLAYLGAKPRSPQTGFSIKVQQVHPALIQRQYGLAQQYMYPQAFLQPSLVLQSHLSPSQASLTSPYLDYSSAYVPYTPSPSARYLSYHYSPATPGPTISAPLTPPTPIHPSLNTFAGLSVPPAACLQYTLHQPDHMQ